MKCQVLLKGLRIYRAACCWCAAQNTALGNSLEIRSFWGFPGGPVLGCLVPTAGATVQSLVREIRSYMLCGSAKKKKGKRKESYYTSLWGFPGGPDGKNSFAMQETWVRSLSWEDPVEKGMATHSSILAWRIPWTGEPGRLRSMGLHRVGHDWTTNALSYIH